MDPSYNDSFGSFAQPTAVVSDDKGKKRWIIVAIVFLILALVAIIAAVFIGGGKFKTGFTPEEKYLNYIVNGDVDNSVDVGTEYSPVKDYVFADAVYLDDYQASYFDKAIELLNNTNLDRNSLEYTEQVAMLKMYRSYKALMGLGPNGIVELYSSEGADGVKSGLLNEIYNLNGNMNTYIDSYKTNAVSFIENILKMINIVASTGCELLDADSTCLTSDEVKILSSENTLILNNIEEDIRNSVPVFVNQVYLMGGKNE